MDEIVKHLITQGPGYLLAAVFLALFIYERVERKKAETAHTKVMGDLVNQLIEVSKDSVKASVASNEVLRRVEDTLSYVVRFKLPSRSGGARGPNEPT